MKPLNFFIECDPVVFDCWIVDKQTNQKRRKATSEEVALWEQLQNAESVAQRLSEVTAQALAGEYKRG